MSPFQNAALLDGYMYTYSLEVGETERWWTPSVHAII